MKKAWNRKLQIFWKGWGFSILITVIIATSFKSAIADWNIVPTVSMKPTIMEGDHIFVNKLAYDLKFPYTTRHIAKWSNPQRGDIVVFYSPADQKRLVKRVVGLPGDTITLLNNNLIINGEVLKYEAVDNRNIINPQDDTVLRQFCFLEDLSGRKHPVMITPYRSSFRSFEPFAVPEESYFMMGDNRITVRTLDILGSSNAIKLWVKRQR